MDRHAHLDLIAAIVELANLFDLGISHQARDGGVDRATLVDEVPGRGLGIDTHVLDHLQQPGHGLIQRGAFGSYPCLSGTDRAGRRDAVADGKDDIGFPIDAADHLVFQT